jgi:hypothetical protein
MAVKTPDSIIRESFGSLTAHIAVFSTNDIDDGDTWATGISNIVFAIANGTDDPTQEKEGIECSRSSSTITFNCGESNRTAEVLVLSKS